MRNLAASLIAFVLLFLWWMIWSFTDYRLIEFLIGLSVILGFVSSVFKKPISLFFWLWFFGLYVFNTVEPLSGFLWSYLIGSICLLCMMFIYLFVVSISKKQATEKYEIEADSVYGCKKEIDSCTDYFDRRYLSSTDPVSIWRE